MNQKKEKEAVEELEQDKNDDENESFAPSAEAEAEPEENMNDEDLDNFFSDMLDMMRLDDPDYSVHSKYHIHINHAIDLGDLLIATILALIFIHMFMRDFISSR